MPTVTPNPVNTSPVRPSPGPTASARPLETLRRRSVWVPLLFLAWASAGTAHADPRRVLLLYSYEREFAPHSAFAAMFRPALSQASPDPIDFIEVSMQAVRSSRTEPDEAIVDRMQSMFGGRRFDLVVTIGGPAATLAQKFRTPLFPDTPTLLADVDRRFVQSPRLTAFDAVVAVDHNPTQMIDEVLRLLPETKTVLVIIGASQLERFWLDEVKREFRRFDLRLNFIWTNDMSFAEMLKRSAGLPPHSAIFYGVLSLDAKGDPQVESRTLAELHAAANAPIFGLHSPQLGQGIVGGPLLSIDELSRNTAAVAMRILRGESPRGITTAVQVPGTATFDWREVRRWGIDESRLSPASVVKFREPTAWQRYRMAIVMGATLAGAQCVIVVVLVINRRRKAAPRPAAAERLLSPNAEMVRMWTAGPERRSELGNGWTAYVHPDDVERCLDAYREAFERREPFQMEYRVRCDEGEYRRVIDTGVPRFAGEHFSGYVGSAVDITELTLAQTALSGLSRRLMQAHERERASIARKLHDDICQRMMALTLQLHGAHGTAANGQQARLAEVSDQLSNLARETFAISDPVYRKLELLGLAAAARGYCQELSAHGDVTIDFVHEDVPHDLPNDVALALFRVLQEAAGNALRHAGVRDLWVSLRGTVGEVWLEVADLGVGFDPDKAMEKHGLGLLAMRERLSLVGGHCAIESQPGAGARVCARVPLSQTDRLAGERLM